MRGGLGPLRSWGGGWQRGTDSSLGEALFIRGVEGDSILAGVGGQVRWWEPGNSHCGSGTGLVMAVLNGKTMPQEHLVEMVAIIAAACAVIKSAERAHDITHENCKIIDR